MTKGRGPFERTSGSVTVTVTVFSIYDAHGNDVASFTHSGSGGNSLGDRRSYDALAVVRPQQSGGDPKLRYCASLGHRADDESGLVYMRARYYEPASGRFMSEDPAMGDRNWFAYGGNDPVNQIDSDGHFHTDAGRNTDAYVLFMGAGLSAMCVATAFGCARKVEWCLAAIETAAMAFVGALGCTDIDTWSTIQVDAIKFMVFGVGFGLLGAIAGGLSTPAADSLAGIAVASTAAYSTMLVAGLFWCYERPDDGGGE